MFADINITMTIKEFFGFGSKRATTIDDIEERSRKAMGGGFGALFYGGGGGSFSTDKAMLLSAVYRCVAVISDGVAQLPFEPFRVDDYGYKTKAKDIPLYNILNKQPNARMSRYTFVKLMITSMLLRGSGNAYIERDNKGNVIALHFVPAEFVTINPPQFLNEPPTYSIIGINDTVQDCDIIRVLNMSYDGINGVSTIHHAVNTLGLANDAEAHAKGFFSGGCNVGGVLKAMTPLSQTQKSELKRSWEAAFSPTTGKPNGVAVLEQGLDFQPISINPADSQLLDTRAFQVIDICRFFNVSPVKCFDLSKSSYSTVEATNLSFLTDTLTPLLSKLELEFERKLFAPDECIDLRFDTSSLLRADKKSLAEYYKTLFNIGVISPNEIRREIDLPAADNGDEQFVQANVITLSKAVKNTPANSAISNDGESEETNENENIIS